MNDVQNKQQGCGPSYTPRLAEAYIPFQCWETPYKPAEAMKKGTIFPSLFMAGERLWMGGGMK